MPNFRLIYGAGSQVQINMGHDELYAFLQSAFATAEMIALQGCGRFDAVMAPSKNRNKRKAWENDSLICQFFGDDAPWVVNIRAARRRMRRCAERLRDNLIKVRLAEQNYTIDDVPIRATNSGTFLSPNYFRIFPRCFNEDFYALHKGIDPLTAESIPPTSDTNLRMAGLIVHELMHDWQFDKKVEGESVYGELQAMRLADNRPGAARRSPENYSWFCMRLADPTGKL